MTQTPDTEMRSEEKLPDGTRIIRWAPAHHDIDDDRAHQAPTGIVTGLAMQWHTSLPDNCDTIAVEVLVPRAEFSGLWLCRAVTLTAAEESPALTAVVHPDEDDDNGRGPVSIEVMCDVDHFDVDPCIADLLRAIDDEHDAQLHRGPRSRCLEALCRAANDVHAPAVPACH